MVFKSSLNNGSSGGVTSVNGQTGVVVLDTGDIAEASDFNYVSDAQLVVIGNTSGTNTGDVSVTDSAEIDFTLTGQNITASLIAGSIDETKLDTSVNASLDLADSSTQPGDNVSTLTNDAGYITGNQTITISGDADGSGTTAITLTLDTVNGNVGSFGSSTSIPSFTVNGKGLITAASGNAVIAPAGTLTGATLAANVLASSLTSVGTIATGVWNGTDIAVADGGTGSSTASGARANLGLVIDTDVAATSFKTIAVSGQSDVVADSATDTVTYIGSGITITTDAGTDSVIFTSTVPTTVTVANEATDTTCFPLFATATTGNLGPKTNANLTFNSSTASLGCTTFVGALTGNASTATALQNARTIGGVSFDGTANIVPQTIQSVNEATDTTCFPLFISASGSQSLQPLNNVNLTFNSNTGALGATLLGGTLTTASQTNITGVGTITTGTWSATNISLAKGGTGAALADPNADRIMFWDDSAGAVDWLTVSTGLSISGTNLTATTPTAIAVANEATDTTCFIGFFTAATGDLGPKTNANLAYDSSTGNILMGVAAAMGFRASTNKVYSDTTDSLTATGNVNTKIGGGPSAVAGDIGYGIAGQSTVYKKYPLTHRKFDRGSATNADNDDYLGGVIKRYNDIATVNGGVWSEVATIDSTGLTANVGATTLYAVPASGAGRYRVTAYLVTTTAASVSSTMPNAQVVYTDLDSNTSVTLDISPILGAAGLGQSGLLTANAVGTVFTGTVGLSVKASTTIQYKTVNYASTIAGMAYALHIILEVA